MRRRAILAGAAAVLATAALCGCVTVLPKAKPVQLYRFGHVADAPGPQAPSLAPGGAARGLILGEVNLPRSSAGDGILTVSGEEAAYIGGARWVEPAAVLFEADLRAAFAARAGGVLLLDRGQLSAASGVLRLDVLRFETRYGPGAPPTVVVRMRATLDRPGGASVLARDIDVRQAADADRVSAIVSAYDSAVGRALDALVDWTDAAAPSLPSPATAH